MYKIIVLTAFFIVTTSFHKNAMAGDNDVWMHRQLVDERIEVPVAMVFNGKIENGKQYAKKRMIMVLCTSGIFKVHTRWKNAGFAVDNQEVEILWKFDDNPQETGVGAAWRNGIVDFPSTEEFLQKLKIGNSVSVGVVDSEGKNLREKYTLQGFAESFNAGCSEHL